LAGVLIASSTASPAPAPAPSEPPVITLDGGVPFIPQAPDPSKVDDPKTRGSLLYAGKVCHAAKLGGFRNARVLDYGPAGEPLPFPLGPWRIYCQHGTLEIAWRLVK